MRRIEIAALIGFGMLVGCMAGAPRPDAQAPTGASHATAPAGATMGAPAGFQGASVLVLDRGDVSIGTTVEFHRLPDPGELQDAAEQLALRHVIVALPSWPEGNGELPRFTSLPPEADVIVVLPGYPPDRAALDAWNYAVGRIRMVLVVDGPPASGVTLDDLNTARYLERVIARMERPSRAGFERLQRPLSFMRVVE